MEQLKELEQVQSIMLMMQSVGAINSSNNTNSDSNRFLANFILFMMQPAGDLDMNQKCRLISENFPKISSVFLEEALCQLCDKGLVQLQRNLYTEDSLSHHCEDDKVLGLFQADCEDVAMITLDSMQRANSTLEDFAFSSIRFCTPTLLSTSPTSPIMLPSHLHKSSMCRSYFMFHEMDASSAESIFKYLPLLSFTESYIYQLDTINEKLLQFPFGAIPDLDRKPDWVANRSWVLNFVKSFRTDAFRPLAFLLERYGIFTDRIRDELKCGEEYWALERKLCCALANKQEIQVEDVMKAIHLKSFDYRVLNLLLYQLNGKKINEIHMEFLLVSEFLVEVSDDLFDYEDDVVENNFNILRMFVRIYGASSAPALLAKSITEAEEKYRCLLSSLDPELSHKYQKRCEEATKEGGKVLGPPLGTWSIPCIIEDEDLYRYEVSNACPPTH